MATGWPATSSTSTARPPSRPAGCGVRTRLLEPLEPGARSRLAVVPDGLPRGGERRHRAPRASWRSARPSSGGAAAWRTSRCWVSRSRAGCSSPAPRRARACAAWTRRRRRARRRGDDPDLDRLDVLPARLRLRRGARLQAGVRMVRPDRGVRRALRQRLHARLLPRALRRGPSLARPLGRRPRRARCRGRTTSRARAPRTSPAPLVWLAELRRRQGRAAEAERLLADAGERPRAQLCRAELALDARRRRPRGRARRTLPAAGRRRARLGMVPALELLAHARIARGELDAAAAAVEALRAIELTAGVGLLRAAADLAHGALEAAGGGHEQARPLLEDALDGFERGGDAVRGGAGADRPGRRAWSRSVAPSRRAGGDAAIDALEELGAAVEAPGARGAAATRRGSGAASRADAARARGPRAPDRGTDEPPDRRAPRGERAHGASPRDGHPAQARPALARRPRPRTPCARCRPER